jgi:2-C-methyl-D-erythritol 4-phosphate cytidylyltransferase
VVVEGDPRNVKVTTADDLAMVRALLGAGPPAERPVHKRF